MCEWEIGDCGVCNQPMPKQDERVFIMTDDLQGFIHINCEYIKEEV